MKLKIKDYIKIYIFPNFIQLLYQLGFNYSVLGKFTFFKKSNLIAQAKNLGSFKIKSPLKKQKIYFLLMLPGSGYHLYTESLIALGLKKRGHDIFFVIDDNILPIHELKKIGNEKNWDYEAERDFFFAEKFLDKLGLDFIKISELVRDVNKLRYEKKYDSILEATLLKHYKIGLIDNTLPLIRKKTELIKKAISITEHVGKCIAQLNPDKVIMSHGIYSTWGPPFQILTKKKIDVLVHGRGKRKNSKVFNWNKTGDSWNIDEEWDKIKTKKLNSNEINDLAKYLDSRILHRDDVFVYNFGENLSNDETFKLLKLDPEKPVYTLFTNVLWDAASAQREIAFKNPIEWVIETIKWFKTNPEKQLIVKIHPAEVIIGTNMPFYDIILSKVNPPSNVRIIKPSEKVNSWSIYNISELGIVHTTTVGMEMPLVNRPCIVVSKTHYRNKGFTIDVNSKEDYFKALKNFNPQSINYKKNKIQALKYAYLIFIRYQIPFNYFFEEISTDIRGFRFNNINEYLNDINFSNILNSIENKNPILK